ncbi:uncharacterized protein LOC127846488 isoform X2 [Dreissena polymorpha]|uniref:uncharacterized protein LOC127846488 isoform X2 n=1 Tax=Dreissena polymorpha TaxID=45954 RepID=UPI002264D1FA|nr:uncharacterized protein LOC127846488 isoform X2 [Dreissena polymorpha]
MDIKNRLIQYVKNFDYQNLQEILHLASSEEKGKIIENGSLFHELEAVLTTNYNYDGQAASKIVYTLTLHGADINQDGNTCLLRYLKFCRAVDQDVLTAFLRCGSDIFCRNKDNLDVVQFVLHTRDECTEERDTRAVILQYMPGVWRAVAADDVGTVRRLINQWCHINVVKDGLSVTQLSFEKGTENIIRVVTGIGPSMDMAHAVLASDYRLVEKLLQTKSKNINVNIKNLADGGVTPVFYAMCQNNAAMVDLLLKHGARLDVPVRGDRELEMPLYFAALSHKPAIDAAILRHCVPETGLDHLYYQGKNVIFHLIDSQADPELFGDVLSKCSSSVLTQRIMGNMDALSYAVYRNQMSLVDIINQFVLKWCCDGDHPGNRNILCLHGYQFVLPLTSGESTLHTSLEDFYQLVSDYERYKAELCEAVEVGDADTVREMLYTESWSCRGLDVCHADFRCAGDGQPLLHKAVLRKHHEVVMEIGKYYTQTWARKLDTVRDQYFRTALHYVYAMDQSQQMIGILEDYGMSEYTMDKDGRSPVAFKDRIKLAEMRDLLQYHLIQDFSAPEPDPWSVTLPLPITGFLNKCLHSNHHHGKKGHEVDNKGHYHSTMLPNGTSSELNRGQDWQKMVSQYMIPYEDQHHQNIQRSHGKQSSGIKNRVSFEKQCLDRAKIHRQTSLNPDQSRKHYGNDHQNSSQENFHMDKFRDETEISRSQSETNLDLRTVKENGTFGGYYKQDSTTSEANASGYDSDVSSNASESGHNYEADQSELESDLDLVTDKSNCLIL